MAQKTQAKTITTPGRMEVVREALACLVAGSLYIILLMTLSMHIILSWLLGIIGAALLITAFILLIFTFKDRWLPKTRKILNEIKLPLLFASLFSLIISIFRIVSLLNDKKLQVLGAGYGIFVIICLLLIIAVLSLILNSRRQIK